MAHSKAIKYFQEREYERLINELGKLNKKKKKDKKALAKIEEIKIKISAIQELVYRLDDFDN